MKARLRAIIGPAMKERRLLEARVARALIAALDNAEAQPVPAGPASVQHRFSSGSAEVKRRRLGRDEVRRVVLAEINEREHAAAELRRVGQMERAEALHAEAQLAKRWLE